MARIYIARPFIHQWRKTSDVLINGRLVGRLAPKTFFVIDVPQGMHTVTVVTDAAVTRQVVVEAGQHYMLRYQMDFWLNRYTGKLTFMQSEDARRQISTLHLTALHAQ